MIIFKQNAKRFFREYETYALDISKFYSSCAIFVIYWRNKIANILFLASKNIGDEEAGMSVKWSIAFFDFVKEGVNELCVRSWKLGIFWSFDETQKNGAVTTRVELESTILENCLTTHAFSTDGASANESKSVYLSRVYIESGKLKQGNRERVCRKFNQLLKRETDVIRSQNLVAHLTDI